MARQNDHKRAEELISAYLDKQVSAEEKSFFERHIASCAECRAQLEATRSMIAALKAMPAVKAPRSFVLPREMARQPQRSFLSLYPALRLATVVAAMAFVVLFAGDLLISQMGGAGAPQPMPAAVPASAVMQAQAPEEARQVAPTQEPAAAETYSDTVAAPLELPAPAAGAAAKAGATEVVTETAMVMTSVPTATPAATAVADAANQAQMMLSTTPEPTEPVLEQQATSDAEQPAAASSVVETAPAPTINPLRVIEIALLALVVALGVATLIVRRRQA
jgi:anti-sigma factor RsiW